MTSLDKAIIAAYEKSGKRFEIYVDPDQTYAYKEGSKKDLKNILVSEEVYINAKKGERHKSADIEKVFGTTDIMQILEFILKNGEVQLTTEQRKKKLEEKRKQIIDIIVREAIDPRTNAPHTKARIESAMEQIKIAIDPWKDPREQLPDIIKEMRLLLPMKFEKVTIAIKVPAEHAHKCYGTLKNYGIKQEQWAKNGDFIALIEIFGGLQGELYDKLNKLTSGTVETKIIQK